MSRAAILVAGIAGIGAAAAAGCGEAGFLGRGGNGGGSAEGAPGEASQGLTSAQVCVSIRRAGLTGTAYDTGLALKVPAKNFGTSQTMAVGPVGTPAVDNQVLLKFDLSAIPSGANTNIVTAAVNLARYQPPSAVGPIDVYSVATNTQSTTLWLSSATTPDENSVTWQSFYAGATLGAKETSFSNGTAFPSFGLTALVQRWVRNQLPNNGIVLKEPGADVTGFWTSEYPNFYSRPELYVCYTVTCNPGFADCNNNGADGCETNVTASATNCGACGNVCNVANATAACAGSACAVGSCNLGFGDCDGSPANGCETLLTSNQNCGACGVACALPHGASSCTTGTCALTSCNAGFYDCDGNPGNGCEAMPCANLSHCATNAGCQSGVCQGGFCATPICTDGVQNGTESAIDCGGTCSPCAVGKTCNLGSDCTSGVCVSGICAAPTCGDAVKNGAETAADCGGPVCPTCANGLTCAVGADCQSGVCTSGVCQVPVCNDGVKNGAETAVDCGGGACPACPAGKACLVGGDCLDLVCTGNICQLANCSDGVKNGTETGPDCGGSCTACNPGQPCTHGYDCQSGVCNNGVCQSPTCSDGIKNGNETGVDCGGTCTVPEICDGVDNDCNGLVDDGLGSTTCGVGACQVTVQNCVAGHTQTCVPLAPQVEVCDGLIDDDCDGVVDNGCACTDGHTQSCYTAAPATLGIGVCTAGVQTCAHGQWGACVGEVTPAVETCDGLDNDCNGTADDNLGQTVCGIGACQVTTPNCLNGLPQACTPRAPGVESCNNVDDDCDGVVDNNLPTVTCGVGACQNTVPSCVNGQANACAPLAPSPETCDGLDNDCDGVIDNGNPGGNAACATGASGVCAAGTTQCSNGKLICAQNALPSAEICDGLDNNCNGQSDEGNPGGGAACSTGQLGVCAAGTTACSGGGVVCNQNTAAAGEICDGLDNDCDGAIDNGNPGGGLACSTGHAGVCAAGLTACTGGATVCNQLQTAHAETCNGLDDDCDGTVDNGNPGGGLPCNTGLHGACSAGVTSCSGGQVVCVQTVFPTAETCDGVDNDCDGAVDNGNPGANVACSTGKQGICAAGTTACTAGSIVCNQTNQPHAETCNGLDDDCDGTIDNGNPGANVACSTGKLGICAAGTTVCSSGQLSCQQTNQPHAESCNGLDDDCDGTVDNGNPGGGQNCNTGHLGVCASGTTACTAGSVVCNQNVQPGAEVCDGSLDENCNGQVDEGCNCVNGAVQSCYTGAANTLNVGACHAGTQMCLNGNWGSCSGQVLPAAETCDGVDNNCNGSVDDGLGTISCGVGACGRTVAACVAGHANTCVPGTPVAETCDGVDNDCDGVIDNGNPGANQACSTGKLGICAAGTTACTAGAIVCNQTSQPTVETCNGLDDNCNGTVDEGVLTTYYRDADGDGFGNPSVTIQACSPPAGYVANNTDCNDGNAAIKPTAVEVCDGIDNNCNGQIDENLGSTTCGSAGCTVTVQNCVGGVPQTCQVSAVNGQACSDGNACTQTDTCQNGTCTGGNPVVCGASDQCHSAGTCNTSTGVCSNPAKTNGTSCSDGDACTQTDTCQSGVCTGGNPVTCSASDQCHNAGTCNSSTGTCSNPAKTNGTACNDGNACTQSDTCQAGTCTGASPVTCTASDQCHSAGTCNTSTGTCSNPALANGTSCNDGNACTQSDTCQSGTCTGASPVTCTASDQCHAAGTCNTSTGACTNPTVANGTACNDGNACTQSDTCQSGTCTGASPVVCTASDQCHNAGTCNTSNGTCSNPAKANGTACNDGNACTQSDTCQSGTCTGASPVTCSASDQCHNAGTCNTSTGTCSNPAKANGTACNDGNGCTASDVCSNGACGGTNLTGTGCSYGACGSTYACIGNALSCQATTCCGDGVCNGGETCHTCPGDCGAPDSCGVCGGGNAAKGCDGVCFSGKVVDSCGVCGGNNAAKGCDGVCFSGKTVDSCGQCGGNNAAKGCNGVCFSGVTYDACGVCGGNNSEIGCNGVCFSGVTYDACGVCGGNNSEIGCNGVCFSGLVVDSCGVCGGNNNCGGGCPYVYSQSADGFSFESTVGGAALLEGRSMDFAPLWARLDRAQISWKDGVGQTAAKVLIGDDEIAYLDEAHLSVVNHPAGYEVVSSSSIFWPMLDRQDPGELYALRTAALRAPLAATWQDREDVTATIGSLDDRAVAYDKQVDNYYDVDFGAVVDPSHARLVIEGWKVREGRDVPVVVAPQPPRLEVQQLDGSWKRVLKLAYPRGDRKAEAFDLSAVTWPQGHYRMRIYTGVNESGSGMWYLDRVRLTEDAALPVTATDVPAAEAKLSFAGAPQMLGGLDTPRLSLANGGGVLRDEEATSGRFTRYGDVKPLLGRADDMLVVMRRGDVVDLRFEGIAPAPAGLVQTVMLRTELLFKPRVGVGATKATEVSGGVAPLPFHGMSHYPYGGGEQFPSDAAHRRYLEQYNTREYQPGETRWGK